MLRRNGPSETCPQRFAPGHSGEGVVRVNTRAVVEAARVWWGDGGMSSSRAGWAEIGEGVDIVGGRGYRY